MVGSDGSSDFLSCNDKTSEELLSQSSYRVLPSDPTTKHKKKLIALLKTIKAEGGSVIPSTKGSTLQGQAPPNIMVYQRSIKRGAH